MIETRGPVLSTSLFANPSQHEAKKFYSWQTKKEVSVDACLAVVTVIHKMDHIRNTMLPNTFT